MMAVALVCAAALGLAAWPSPLMAAKTKATPPSAAAGKLAKWREPGGPKEARQLEDRIALLLEPRRHPSAARLEAIAALLGPQASVERFSEGVAVLVKVPAGQAEAVLAAKGGLLASLPDVRAAAPVYAQDPARSDTRAIPTGRVVTRFKGGATAATAAAAARRFGLEVETDFPAVKGAYILRASAPADAPAAAQALDVSGLVMWAAPDWLERKAKRAIPNDTFFGSQWHLRNTGQSGGTLGADVNATPAWDTHKGTTQTAIVIADDGLEIGHEDLVANTALGEHWDFVDSDSDPSPAIADENHGTACGGVAAARGNNVIGVSGSAPEARLVGYRFLSADSDAVEASAAARGMDWVNVSSNSWGPFDDRHLEGPGPLEAAALEAGATTGRGGKGVVYVWAGGNGRAAADDVNFDGYANSRYTLAVGATTNQAEQAPYSESGAALMVNAPSNGGTLGIYTTDRTGGQGYNPPGGPASNLNYYSNFGGTSSAAPLAAGVAALVLQAKPALTYRDVQRILMLSAQKNDPADTDWTKNGAGHWVSHKYGFGRVDAAAASAMAVTYTPDPAETTYTASVSPGLAIPDNNATGVSSTITVPADLAVTYVDVTFSASDHAFWNDLRVTLTSPSGVASVLAPEASAAIVGPSYNGWRFGTARHLDERSQGGWVLKVQDLRPWDTGTFQSWGITVYGVADPPLGPATELTAASGDATASLSWRSPRHPAYDSTRILRSTVAFATTATPAANPDTQTIAYEDTATVFADSGLTNGLTYYYTAFASNGSGGFSDPATVTATPTEPTPPLRATSLSATVTPALPGYAASVTVAGTLTVSGGGVLTTPTVNVQASFDGASWFTTGTATYDATAQAYKASRTILRKTFYRLDFPGTAEYLSSTSPAGSALPKAWLSSPYGMPPLVRRGAAFTAHGYLKPWHSGYTTIWFYRLTPLGWRRYRAAAAVNQKYSSYTRWVLRDFKLWQSGRYYLRAYHKDASHRATWGSIRYFTVR